ncbi:MAG: hypothetical protein CSA33_04480 [Desulfobulbus propionicus]|nr:MAG: hypothetical protein CSA33_04480 [Desulfobulbus propionicus]
MKDLLDDLTDLSGVFGVCIYHKKKGPLISKMPGVFNQEKLLEMGKLLVKIVNAGKMTFQDLTDVVLQYDESVFVVRELEDNIIVLLVCDPDFNQNLVTMSLNLFHQEIQGVDIEGAIAASEKVAPKNEVPQPDSNVVRVLNQIKEQLPSIVGPMADIVFDDSVAIWREQGHSTVRDILALVELLKQELSTPEQTKRFNALMAPIISKYVRG